MRDKTWQKSTEAFSEMIFSKKMMSELRNAVECLDLVHL